MTGAVVTIGNRYLPRGWRDFGVQLAIWFGFLLAYQVVRGVADRNPARAFENGLWVIEIEQRVTGLVELSLQQMTHSSDVLTTAVSWTYWNSEFTVVCLTLLWVYLRRNDHFYRFRNWILLANTIGLIGYVVAPTAPPRMFQAFGFDDTLLSFGSLNHGSGLIELASNPYAAMPSLHAADALIVGISMALIVKSRWAKGALARVAGVGLVRGHGHGEPLLARHRRRCARCAHRRCDRLPPRAARRCRRTRASDGSSVLTDPSPAAQAGRAGRRVRSHQAGVHAGGPRDPRAVDARRREDEADARHAHARRA